MPDQPGAGRLYAGLGFAGLVTHYRRHAAWLEEDILLPRVLWIAGIPGVLIHGRLDFGSAHLRQNNRFRGTWRDEYVCALLSSSEWRERSGAS